MRLRRKGGAYRPPYGQEDHTATGDLHLTHRTTDGRKIPLLKLLGADPQWPSLLEPRLVALSAREFTFLGFERYGEAWVLKQWDCELL